MLRVACTKDNFANFRFQIMSPDPYFYFIFVSGAQLCNFDRSIKMGENSMMIAATVAMKQNCKLLHEQ